MCTVNVNPDVEQALSDVLRGIRDALAAEWGVDPESLTVGPVDFGTALHQPAGPSSKDSSDE